MICAAPPRYRLPRWDEGTDQEYVPDPEGPLCLFHEAEPLFVGYPDADADYAGTKEYWVSRAHIAEKTLERVVVALASTPALANARLVLK